MSPLLGGEIVIAFLAVRIAIWIWRSRASLGALFEDDAPHPPPPRGGKPLGAPRPRLRLVRAPAGAEPGTLPRAA